MNDFDEAYGDDPDVYGRPYPALLEHFSARSPGTLLDLGCGQGRNAVPLASLGYDVTAVDAAAVGVGQAVARATEAGGSVRGITADITTWVTAERYDTVLADMVLHSIDDDDRAALLDRITAAVAPGGCAFLVVPEPGPLADAIVAAVAPWPTRIVEMHHRLDSGEHAGDYAFTAVIAERPPD